MELTRRRFIQASAAMGAMGAMGGINLASAEGSRIVIGRAGDSDNLDPVTCTGNNNLFVLNLVVEPLVCTTDSGDDIVACLAESWDISEDGKVYTFHIIPDLKFSDGSPVTAEDWQWTFDRAIEHEESSWHMCVETIDHVECPDDVTVVVYCKEAAASTLANLSIFDLGVQSKAYFESVGEEEYQNGVLGTGPFAFKEWKKGEYLTLEANPYYRVEGKPLASEIEFKVVADDASRSVQLQGGDIDVATDLSWPSMLELEADPNVTVSPDPATMVYWLSLNTTSPILQDVKVREALYLATNAQEICDVATEGYATPASSILNPSSPYWYGCDVPEGNVEAAKALLEEAGYGDGFELTMILRSGNATYETIGQVLQYQWSQIGVTLNFDMCESTAYSAARKEEGRYDLLISGWNDDVPDPAEMMTFVFNYDVVMGYYSWMHMPEDLVAANDQALIELDHDVRKDLYQQIQQGFRDMAIFVPLMVIPWANAYRSDVQGYVQTPMGNWRFDDLTK